MPRSKSKYGRGRATDHDHGDQYDDKLATCGGGVHAGKANPIENDSGASGKVSAERTDHKIPTTTARSCSRRTSASGEALHRRTYFRVAFGKIQKDRMLRKCRLPIHSVKTGVQ